MKILLTGPAGFIGSVLLRRLVYEHKNVHIILRNESHTWRIKDLINDIHIHYASLLDSDGIQNIVKKVNPFIIYHLAANGAYSYQNDAQQILETNILGTWNLLRACNAIDYKLFVNTGSSSEYGFKQYAMREHDSLEPASYYAVAKCSQTFLCSHIAKQEKRPIVTIRPFSVYGPYEESTRLIPTLMMAFLRKKEVKLASPDIARDEIYTDDIVDAYRSVDKLIKYPGECFNIGTGIQSTIKDIVDVAMKVSGRSTTFRWGSMKNRNWDTNVWVADISKARSLLQWAPQVTLEDGLRKTWKWFQKYSRYYV